MVWASYDWASTPFVTTVLAVYFGPYLTTVAKRAADTGGFVHPLGIPVAAGAVFPYAVSISVLLQVFTMLLIGAISDRFHHEKQQFVLYAYLGAATTAALFFVKGSNYMLGALLLIAANVFYGNSYLLYDTFLIRLAQKDERDGLSTLGWSAGILGGAILLLLNVALVTTAEQFGLDPEDAIRISLASAGIWWAIFGLISALGLKVSHAAQPAGDTFGPRFLTDGLRSLARYPQTLLFVIAYMLYADGVHTAVGQASVFGQEELRIPISTLGIVLLAGQFIAVASAVGFYRLARVIGAKRAVLASLFLWTVSIVYGFWLQTAEQFIALAVIFSIAVGGSQALSRSLFSQLVPAGREANYFALFEISSRGTAWLGPLTFGLTLQFSGSYRAAILSIVLFFLTGTILFARVKLDKGIAEARGSEPAAAA